ncbi:hypothetical protein [Niallia sp. NCCP-28]|uniref:hypothetical protein n=1 Tax=Niallia sp. NCCP-28 TaxID=2934712 RepID=UPI00208CE547|nr:hypothetical protein [Niallia sp. NCCP-28]GKU84744.1 hypothetical protein NCCP28_41400 [Niallia sp. NCCP-28]
MLSSLLKQKKKNFLAANYYLNLPDISFYKRCDELYGINRGSYNVIDHWFFEYGMTNVVYRRIYILAFLDFIKEGNVNSPKSIKFGKGGITKKLNEFILLYLHEPETTSVNQYRIERKRR